MNMGEYLLSISSLSSGTAMDLFKNISIEVTSGITYSDNIIVSVSTDPILVSVLDVVPTVFINTLPIDVIVEDSALNVEIVLE